MDIAQEAEAANKEEQGTLYNPWLANNHTMKEVYL